MTKETVHQCKCPKCQQPVDHPDKELHHQMNLLISRLDEQQRRWYVALEAKKLGHGGITLLSQITGMSVDSLSEGRRVGTCGGACKACVAQQPDELRRALHTGGG